MPEAQALGSNRQAGGVVAASNAARTRVGARGEGWGEVVPRAVCGECESGEVGESSSLH